MTEQEIVEMLDDIWTYGHEPTDKQREAVRNAMDALEELQQYRTIGTVEEIRRMQKYATLAKKHGTIGQAIDSCAEYEEIGTVEECREAMERQQAKKTGEPYINGYGTKKAECLNCHCTVMYPANYCKFYGQKLDWSE